VAGAEKMNTPLVIFILALAVVLFACASPAAAGDITIPPGATIEGIRTNQTFMRKNRR
jgi:hypothetical protein